VLVHGELWEATSGESIAADAPVEITAVEGLTLVVKPVSGSPAGRTQEGETP
jgi:membrane-bound ClpP family serine protease